MWKVRIVYVGVKVEKILERIREEMGRIKREIGWIVGGNFNARTEEWGGIRRGKAGVVRRSKDKVLNREKLIK